MRVSCAAASHISSLTLYRVLSPVQAAARCRMPALFLHGAADKMIPPRHSKECAAAYNGEASVHIVRGDHASLREADFWDLVAEFFSAQGCGLPGVCRVSRPLRGAIYAGGFFVRS